MRFNVFAGLTLSLSSAATGTLLAMALGAAATTSAGCHSSPFCLNCGDGGTSNPKGDLTAGDLMTVDLTNPNTGIDQSGPPDLAGPCVQTNNGVEKCDGLDNDCNGVIDDVLPAQLQADPNNCGACGTVCDFVAQKQFGQCVTPTGGVPACQPAGCLPGYVDIDPNTPGCEYHCTPTTPATEVCDGVDNDCDGTIDNGFRDASGKYTVDVNNCGVCGNKCGLPGAINKCVAGTSGTGQCAVDHCINNGTATYRHNPASGDLETTGCEYKCPTASTTVTTGSDDCDSVTCAFPTEICDNLDNNCNFTVDEGLDNLGPCGLNCPGGNVAKCVGACKAGTSMCAGGVTVCMGSTGPKPETCDTIDNDCNGIIDDAWVDASGHYTISKDNCGACGTVCSLANANNACHDKGGGVAECIVQSCKAGFAFPSKTSCTTGTLAPTVNKTGVENGAGGLGCYYSCPVATREFCDGKDNDCDGCIDNNNATGNALDGQPPANGFCKIAGNCATVGVICNSRGTATAAWKCDYAGLAATQKLCLDASGNPTVTEAGCANAPTVSECDGQDNNCNGRIDEGLGIYQECTTGGSCVNGRTTCAGSGQSTCNTGFVCSSNLCVTSCQAGVGACRTTGPKACTATVGTLACTATADATKARDEACDGKDNDCDGLIDESTTGSSTQCLDSTGANPHTCDGVHDKMVRVQAKACQCDPTVVASSTVAAPCPVGFTCGHVTDATGAELAGDYCVQTSPTYQTCTTGNMCTGTTTANRCKGGQNGIGSACTCTTEGSAATGCPAGYVCGTPNGQALRFCYKADDNAQPCTTTAGQCVGTSTCQNLGNPYWMFQYEASRTTAVGAAAGTDEADPTLRRACSTGAQAPWTSVIQSDADDACNLIKDSAGNPMRLCAEFEWQGACVGKAWVATKQWSESATPQTWTGVCNADFTAGTGAIGVTGAATSNCYSSWSGTTGNTTTTGIYDLTGNAEEWTATTVTSGGTTYYRQRGGAYNSPRDGSTCQFSFNLGKADFLNSNVGFRCCSGAAPKLP